MEMSTVTDVKANHGLRMEELVSVQHDVSSDVGESLWNASHFDGGVNFLSGP